MRKNLLVLLMCMALSVNAQQSDAIVIGKMDSINSSILKENRKIMVHVPGVQFGIPPGSNRYPVVYVLDGEAHFNSVVGMMEQLSSVNGNTLCPPMIVVGIPNTNRMRDLTPTHVENAPFIDDESAKVTGGGENFLAFIERELMPYINSKYPTAPYNMFIGHSLGGLVVMDALVNHPHMFNSYVAIDPSMWYDQQNLLKKSELVFKERLFPGKSLYLGVANTMEKGMDVANIMSDKNESSEHIRANLALAKLMENSQQNQLIFKWKYYPEDTHGSVPLITEYDAFRFFFKDLSFQLGMSDFMDDKVRVDLLYAAHYEKVSKILGFKSLPPEDMINGLGYQLLSMKQLDKAEYLFVMNTVNYPTSSNVFDSLGDVYAAKNDNKKAIESYKKALVIREVPDTRNKLDALLAKKKS